VGAVKKSITAICSRWLRKKVNPRRSGIGFSRVPPHLAGDGSLRDIEAQHQQFAMNAPGQSFGSLGTAALLIGKLFRN